MSAGGLPSATPFKIVPRAWQKPVTPPQNVTNTQLHWLLRFAHTTSLHLVECFKITDNGLSSLQQLPLQHLDLVNCPNITDAGRANVQHLSKLQHLNLTCRWHCNIFTDAGLANVQHLTQLQHLNLTSSNVTDAGLSHLQGLQQLRHLSLAFCEKITDAGLDYLISLPLQHLDLTACEITDASLAKVQHLTQLQHLDLTYCSKVTDAGLSHLQGLQQLRHLSLAFCETITDAGLDYLISLPLQHLNLACWTHCNITDAGLAIVQQLTQLQHLDLTSCSKVTDIGLSHLQGLQQLKHLSLASCEKISDAGLDYLLPLPLKHLDLRHCRVTKDWLVRLQRLPLLEYLDVTPPCASPMTIRDVLKIYAGKDNICEFLNLKRK